MCAKLAFVDCMQTAQVRKSVLVPGLDPGEQGYHPDNHPNCTIHGGTFVKQVCMQTF